MTKLGVGIATVLALLSGACSDNDVPPASTAGSTGTGGVAGGGGAGGSGGAPSCDGTEPTNDEKFSQALQIFRDALEAQGVPGGAFAVIKDGKLLNLGVSGTKRASVCDPITPDTLFRTVFATELLTTIATLDAVDDAKLSLTDPINGVVKELHVTNISHGDVDQITLAHLLTETSMYSMDSSDPNAPVCTSLADAFANAKHPVLQAIPGSMQNGNASNFDLAGLALEKVDNKPFVDAVTDRVLAPLAMGGGFDTPTILASDHAVGHFAGPTEAQVEPECPNDDPSQGYYGSIRDMAKVAEYLTGGAGGILEPATLEAMLSKQGPNFYSDSYTVYGASGAVWKGYEVIWQGSHGYGFSEEVKIWPTAHLAVITLMNANDGRPWEVNAPVGKIYDDKIEPFGGSFTPDSVSLKSLEGTYEDPLGFGLITDRALILSVDGSGSLGGTLSVSGGDPMMVSLAPDGCADNFVMTSAGARFWRDDAGNAFAMSLAGYDGPPFFRTPAP